MGSEAKAVVLLPIQCIMALLPSFILLLRLSGLIQAQAFTDCSEFFVGDCTGDAPAEILRWNVGSQEKCQAHCSIEEDCKFYRFEANPGQDVDCHLFKEPFHAYVNHCNLRGGPKREEADQGSSCFDATGDTCEISQLSDCTPEGKVIETTTAAPTAIDRERFCGGYPECKLWTFEKQEERCSLWDDAGNRCKIAFGPHSGTPEQCESSVLPTQEPTTPGPTVPEPSPNFCPPDAGLVLHPDPDHCERYLECFNGVLTSIECPYCNYYDEDKKQCNQPPTVECGSRTEPEPSDTCDSCTSMANGRCPCAWGFFPDLYDCDHYVYCQGTDTPDEYDCSATVENGLYNPENIQCDFDYRVTCGKRPICRGPDPYTQCQCQGAEPVAPRDCSSTQGVYVLEDPYNCQHFQVCMNGNKVDEVWCDAGSYFPNGAQECQPGDGSVCDGRPICEDIKGGLSCTCFE